ncbi:MAG TPA: hypothetical protein PK657_09115 [Legionella sp.]|nr:hypothetical protein [Legionella sp.]
MNEKMEKNKSVTPQEPWLLFGELFVNSYFFNRGVLMVTPKPAHDDESLPSHELIKIKEREFQFHSNNTPSSVKPDSRALAKSSALLKALTHYAHAKDRQSPLIADFEVRVFNKKRREEVFMPLTFGEEGHESGLYVYPWVSKSSHSMHDFKGFSQFITAGCMFGANLQAVTNDGDSVELINHQIRLRPNQHIVALKYDAEPSAFEQVLFDEFSKYCILINQLSTANEPKKLLYHLPCADYMLFGLSLFIKGQITLDAFDALIQAIRIKEQLYHQTIGALCATHQIEVIFQSPFDALMPNIDRERPALSLLHLLGAHDLAQLPTEEHLVATCLRLLQSHQANLDLNQVWRELTQVNAHPITTFEDLFKQGNAVLLACGTKDKNAYECCSLLPISEKQIPIHYESLSLASSKKSSAGSATYPPLFNLTTFEPVVTYSPTASGLLFYFATHLSTLKNLLFEKKGLAHAARNIGLFASQEKKQNPNTDTIQQSKPVSLESITSEQNNENGLNLK